MEEIKMVYNETLIWQITSNSLTSDFKEMCIHIWFELCFTCGLFTV